MTSKEALIRLSKSAGAYATEFGDKMYDTDKEALAVLKADLDVLHILRSVLGVWSYDRLDANGNKFEWHNGLVIKDQNLTQGQLKQIKDCLEGK